MNKIGLIGNLYKPLSADELKIIHEAALQILEETGVLVDTEEAVQILKDNGVKYCIETKRAYFDTRTIERYLAYAPSKVMLFARNGYDLQLEDDRVHLGTGGAA